MLAHIDPAITIECYSLFFQQFALLCREGVVWRKFTKAVDNPIPRQVAVFWRGIKRIAHLPCMMWFAKQYGNLTIGNDTTIRHLLNYLVYLFKKRDRLCRSLFHFSTKAEHQQEDHHPYPERMVHKNKCQGMTKPVRTDYYFYFYEAGFHAC